LLFGEPDFTPGSLLYGACHHVKRHARTMLAHA
jgi:hypothetical protein